MPNARYVRKSNRNEILGKFKVRYRNISINCLLPFSVGVSIWKCFAFSDWYYVCLFILFSSCLFATFILCIIPYGHYYNLIQLLSLSFYLCVVLKYASPLHCECDPCEMLLPNPKYRYGQNEFWWPLLM